MHADGRIADAGRLNLHRRIHAVWKLEDGRRLPSFVSVPHAVITIRSEGDYEQTRDLGATVLDIPVFVRL